MRKPPVNQDIGQSIEASNSQVLAEKGLPSGSCSRILPFESKAKIKNLCNEDNTPCGEISKLSLGNEVPRNLRQIRIQSTNPEKGDKINNFRAARANQRRIYKDVAALGATSLGLDLLAGCEQKLRFDRSGIHAWGVFADEPITSGDMIVEYRGELIGNAMAEKREIEYEKANIGSDYMFRVDAHVVCDATKQGNVARFINASCDPNCYTKTITVDGCKRIVIYAKR
jgi:histone-lysine N-methyltransferase SETD1